MLLVLRVAKVEMNSDFANFILTFFSPALSNIALPFFAGCKGNYIFIFCNALANNFSIKAVKTCKSAEKI